MEKKQTRSSSSSSSRTSTMKTTFCIPRFRVASRKSTRLSPMSLLDRFREAVFRLIMLSAITKAAVSNTEHQVDSRSSSSSSNSPANYHRSCYYYHSNDVHNSEAVADCIEFIKRSANYRDNRDSIDSTAEIVVPLPVM